MNSKRKLISCILTLAMVLMFIPAFSISAFAGGGTISQPLDFTDEATQAEYSTEKNGVRWDSEYNTLTLNDATIDCSSQAESDDLSAALKLPAGSEIILEGGSTNTITAGPTNDSSVGIYTQGELTISGEGTLNVSSYQGDCYLSMGIDAYGLTISGVTLNVTGGRHGIYVPYNATETGLEIHNADVTATATGSIRSDIENYEVNAVYCYGKISLDVDSTLSACNTQSLPYAIVAEGLPAGADVKSGGADITPSETTFKLKYSQNGSNPILISFPDICVMDGDSYKSLETAIEAAGTTPSAIKLTKDIVLAATVEIAEDQNITLDLDGHLVCPAEGMSESAFCNDGKLTIKDSNTSAAQHDFYADIDTGRWILGTGENGETPITVYGGCITGFAVPEGSYRDGDHHDCGAIENNNELVIEGGSIIGNRMFNGGGIYSYDYDGNCRVTMNGGMIAGNTAVLDDNEFYGCGGGVSIEGCIFTFNGGEIKSNSADEYGGGIYAGDNASLVINGGTIEENSAVYGGGVYKEYNNSGDRQITMTGGRIEKNTAGMEGGGVYNRGENIILGGTAFIKNNVISSTAEGAEDIPNNLYLAYTTVEFGCQANGVTPPAIQAMEIGIADATRSAAAGTVVAAGADADYSSLFSADDYGRSITDSEEESVHTLTLSKKNYTLLFDGNKAYRNSVSSENDITGQMITRGLEFGGADSGSYNSYIVATKSFQFESDADTSVEFEGKTKLVLSEGGSFSVNNYSDNTGALAVKADKLNIEFGDSSYLSFTSAKADTALKCTTLNVGLDDENSSATMILYSKVSAFKASSEINAEAYSDYECSSPAVWNNNLGTYVTEAGGSVPCSLLFVNPEYKAAAQPVTYYDSTPAPKSSVPFRDVSEGDYYYDAVKWAYSKGITSGKTAYTFVPGDTCTRAEFVTFLWRAAGSPYVNYAMPFTDINEGAYYAEALRWAASEGIVQGVTPTSFNPAGTITRAQAAAYLWRYAGAIQFTNMTANGPAPSPFSDVSNTAYYYSAVLWAKAQGITSGKTDTTFAPNENCLRCQTVVFLYNYFNNVSD